MQLSAKRTGALVAGLLACAASRAHAADLAAEPSLYSMFRSFTDSGHIRVRAYSGDYTVPVQKGSAEVTLHFNREQVTIPAIASPAGSADAIDAITTASRPIEGDAFADYVKTRDEIEVGVSRAHVGASYYVSNEVDYLGQQLALRHDRDFADRTRNLAAEVSYGWDAITPLADERGTAGRNHKDTAHASLTGTEVLSPTTLLRVGLEANTVEGLQHNPYRNVYAGGQRVPERHPDHRLRTDGFVRLSRWLSGRGSLQGDYRLYHDDWGITSHQLSANLSQYVTHAVSTRWEYRWYTQGAARFYRAEYATVDGIDGYRSGDYRMARLASHLFGTTLQADLEGFAAAHPRLGRPSLWLHYERYFNSNNYSANILETGLELRFQ